MVNVIGPNVDVAKRVCKGMCGPFFGQTIFAIATVSYRMAKKYGIHSPINALLMILIFHWIVFYAQLFRLKKSRHPFLLASLT